MPPHRPSTTLLSVLVLAVLALAGCGEETTTQGSDADPEQVDAVPAPALGACRRLTPDDVAAASNATRTVDCTDTHTAQTYAVGTLPSRFEDASYGSGDVGRYAFDACSDRFEHVLGTDESVAMRTVLSWAWFRPSPAAWRDGARWYRCDVVGGGEQSRRYLALPEDVRNLLARPEDRWLVCADGPSVHGAVKIPCSEKHDWRAISTIVLGEHSTPYPGDRTVLTRTREYCSSSVRALLGYPVDYDFGYTWFRQPEWEAGNRRSVCWARTDA